MTITVLFTNYKEPTSSKRIISRSIISAGITSSMESSTEEYIDFENLVFTFAGSSYPILSILDTPYRYVLKTDNYSVPSISKHTIAFSVNRYEPFYDSYELKIDKPKTFLSSAESAFEITGVYLNEFILERSFNNIPNDLKDYDPEPAEDPVYEDYTNLTRLDYNK